MTINTQFRVTRNEVWRVNTLQERKIVVGYERAGSNLFQCIVPTL
jgi:hypothetical protein